MRPILSREEIREFDRAWIARGVPGIVLMENAGRGAAHLIGLKARSRAPHDAPRLGSSVVGTCVRCADERSLAGVTLFILTGSGNNAGDGFVVARHLAGRGAQVRVVGTTPGDKLSFDARVAWQAMEAVGVRLEPLPDAFALRGCLGEADLIVDALLGTGADRPLQGILFDLISAVNASSTPVIALDVPSGLDAEKGSVLGTAVRASHTVTFAHLKRGLFTTHGFEHSGTITVSHIGVPSALPNGMSPSAWLLEESDVYATLERRSRVAHKGKAGRVVVVAGSPGTIGAARLSSRASLRAGAGLVTVVSDRETVHQLEHDVLEVMTCAFTDYGDEDAVLEGAQAFVVGPGLGRRPETRRVCAKIWDKGRPTVIDADALRELAEDPGTFYEAPSRLFVLTPHPGEAAALLKTSIEQIENDRFAAVQELARRYDCVAVLKGPRTLVAAGNRAPVVSAFGSPVLATAGSGDVLSGILGALVVGSENAEDLFARTCAAVALHGMAGEAWESMHSDRGLLASELADLIPDTIARVLLG